MSHQPLRCMRLLTLLALGLAASTLFAARPAGEIGKDWGDPAGQECVDCHMTENPGMTLEWNHSAHGQAGVNCLDCHKAEEGDKDAWKHKKQLVSVIATPKAPAPSVILPRSWRRFQPGVLVSTLLSAVSVTGR